MRRTIATASLVRTRRQGRVLARCVSVALSDGDARGFPAGQALGAGACKVASDVGQRHAPTRVQGHVGPEEQGD